MITTGGLPVAGSEVFEAVVVVAVEAFGLREHLHGVLGIALEKQLETVLLGGRGGEGL